MNRRYVLSRAVYGMLALLVLAFVWVLFSSTRVTLTDEVPVSNDEALFADLALGQSRLYHINSQRVWVTRLSPAQAAQVVTLDKWLSKPDEGCVANAQYCLLSGQTQQSGIYLQFTATPPPQLSSKVPWFGGFVDPTTGEVFDLLGRAYSSVKHQRTSVEQIRQK